MLKATKANRVLRIADEQKDNYLKMGYTITDMDDNLVDEPPDLSHEAEKLRKENEALKAKVQNLTIEVTDLRGKLAAQNDSEKAAKQKASAKSTKAAL